MAAYVRYITSLLAQTAKVMETMRSRADPEHTEVCRLMWFPENDCFLQKGVIEDSRSLTLALRDMQGWSQTMRKERVLTTETRAI